MKSAYRIFNFREATRRIIQIANQIVEEYKVQGYELTLRQLYYQFVARDLLPNTARSYKQLGDTISKGRLSGLIDWDTIEDRTRVIRELPHWDSPADIVEACAVQFRVDTRSTQPNYVEVWVEKEALAGIVEPTCESLDVPCLVCKGYVSQSAIWRASKRFSREDEREERILLYLGDHDPSGLNMVRDIDERLNNIFRSDVKVERIALLMEQIEEYQPPPNPAKVTDSRFAEYVANWGDSCWELDALEPKVLEDVIRRSVEEKTDHELTEKREIEQQEGRDQIQEVADGLSMK